MYLSEIFNLLFYTMPYESEKDCKTISGANYGVFLGNEGVNFPVISHSTKSRIFLKKHCPGSRGKLYLPACSVSLSKCERDSTVRSVVARN